MKSPSDQDFSNDPSEISLVLRVLELLIRSESTSNHQLFEAFPPTHQTPLQPQILRLYFARSYIGHCIYPVGKAIFAVTERLNRAFRPRRESEVGEPAVTWLMLTGWPCLGRATFKDRSN